MKGLCLSVSLVLRAIHHKNHNAEYKEYYASDINFKSPIYWSLIKSQLFDLFCLHGDFFKRLWVKSKILCKLGR